MPGLSVTEFIVFVKSRSKGFWLVYAIATCSVILHGLHGILFHPLPSNTREPEFEFFEAPDYRDPVDCPLNKPVEYGDERVCDTSLVHVAMTLDYEYVRGSIAAVNSVLRHASCPERIFFHFIVPKFGPAKFYLLLRLVRAVFPSLSNVLLYTFREDKIVDLIPSTTRPKLESSLHYARNYLGDILVPCVKRVIYLDSDVVLVDDISKLWGVTLSEGKVIGALEDCHANFTKYFTDSFWSDPSLNQVFEFRSRSPCYFNTGVMVMDLEKWREGHFREKIEYWMQLQKEKMLYKTGSLLPYLLVFGGNVEPIDHRWNQHGLGGDDVTGSCRGLNDGAVSLLHWSGKGKPWIRLDEGRPCLLDHRWKPYDLYNGGKGKGRRGLI